MGEFGLFGLRHSAARDNRPIYKDDRGPFVRHLSSHSSRIPSESSFTPSYSSRSSIEPLLKRKHHRRPVTSTPRTSTMPSTISSSESFRTSLGRSSTEQSSTNLSTGARYKERLHPGKEISLGILGQYHRNPQGLATVYDWKAEEGGYIPFRHQRAHRRRWRQEMREGERADERERLARLNDVEEKKAARRRAYDDHLATKRRV